MRLGRLAATIVFVLVASAAFAEVKWEQYPDPAGNAWMAELDICPNGWTAEMADDFECLDGDRITAVEWWGTDGTIDNSGSLPDHYIIRFYSDVPAGVDMPWSHPGDLLYEEECWDFTAEWDGDLEQFHFYQDLAVQFCQEIGTFYWFSVLGVVCSDDGEGAYWCDCYTVPQWNDEAVIRSDFHGYPEWTAMSEYASGYYGPRELSFVLHGAPPLIPNVVCDPDLEYLTAAASTKTIAVKYLGGGCGAVFGYSIKFSWDSSVVTTTIGDVNEGNLLSDLGGTFFYVAPGTGDEIVVDCALLGSIVGATGPGTLFTIDFTGLAVGTSDIDVTIINVRDQYNNHLSGFYEDNGLLIVDVSAPTITNVMIQNTTLAHTDVYIKDTDGAQVTATVVDDDPAFGTSDIVANLFGLGGGTAVNPVSYDSGTGAAVWDLASVACTPANGTVWVYVDATDAIGNPAAQGSDDIIADNVAPTAVTDFDAAPGNQKCDLSWTMGTDLYPAGVVVQRDDNTGDYPLYAVFKGAWPNVDAFYPGNESLGTNVYNGTGTSTADAVMDRNIYYYQAFCYDEARNYGLVASTARDLATNYWLGDVAAAIGVWGYNGFVNDADIDKLGSKYHEAPGGSPEDEMDVGPTVHPAYGRLGLPTPDDFIGFEDLMIFATNYGAVAAKVVPFLGKPGAGDLALVLTENGRSSNGVVELALRLEGNHGEVKGLTAELEFEGLELLSARLSDEMSSPLADVFFWSDATSRSVQVDAAVLGTDMTIGGSGDVVLFTFQVLDETYSVDFTSAELRGAANEDLTAELEGLSSDGVPVAFKLVQNAPNPFNPVTKVAYHVPSESRVTIRVYDVTGRLVTTLVDGVVEAGRHQAVWNGTNDAGESVGSGVYFCTMEAPDFHDSRKMTLLK